MLVRNGGWDKTITQASGRSRDHRGWISGAKNGTNILRLKKIVLSERQEPPGSYRNAMWGLGRRQPIENGPIAG